MSVELLIKAFLSCVEVEHHLSARVLLGGNCRSQSLSVTYVDQEQCHPCSDRNGDGNSVHSESQACTVTGPCDQRQSAVAMPIVACSFESDCLLRPPFPRTSLQPVFKVTYFDCGPMLKHGTSSPDSSPAIFIFFPTIE